MENLYNVIPAKIFALEQESPLIRTLHIEPELPVKFKTGQFVELTIPNIGEGPFTPSSSHFKSDVFELTVMKTGFVTEYVHHISAGAFVGIRGPFGSHYPLEKFKGKDLLILGGGCGMAPLRSLFLTLLDEINDYKSITLLAGAKTPQDCLYKDQIDSWRKYDNVRILRSVDEVPAGQSWDEDICLITKLLDKVKIDPENNPAIVCGPPVMMKFGTLDLLKAGYKEDSIYLSMEKKMYCGFGQCRHCVIGPYFACKDGPVFTYDQIKNEEAIWD